jgi:NTE family protein
VKLSGVPNDAPDRPVRTGLGMAVKCMETLIGDWNRYRLDEEGVNSRTIYVNTDGVSATDFSLSPATRERLYESGQEAAHAFIALQH